jgi:predicted dinucleotide-binding enzyme
MPCSSLNSRRCPRVSSLAENLGWCAVDAGPLASALHREHMTLLWIKMGRTLGRGPNFVWAMLER